MANAPLSICSFPLTARENSVLDVLYRPLVARGITLSNYNWLKSNFAAADIFHVHWPDAVLMGDSLFRILIKFLAFTISVFCFRLRGIPIIYSVHNISSHEGRHPILEALLWKIFLPQVSAFIHMNRDSKRTFKDWQPQCDMANHVVLPLPTYPQDLATRRTKADCRSQLALPATSYLILSFGLIRPYKGLEHLISAFVGWTDPNARLYIAGRSVDTNYSQTLIQIAACDPRITIELRFFPDSELTELIGAADLVAMSHTKLNNSGTALLALSSGRPVLAPALGAMIDLCELVGKKWLYLFHGALTTRDLARAKEASGRLKEGEFPLLADLDPELIADRLEEIYNTVKNKKPLATQGVSR